VVGAQVAPAALPDEWLDAQITVLSGVFFGRDGFNVAERVYHLRGRRDWVEDIVALSPIALAATVGSAFNQALQGDYTALISPHDHDGSTGYFGKKLVSTMALAT